MQAILERIRQRIAELGMSEAAVAQQGGSRDLIRNWRRALEKGQQINARYDSLALIARALHVTEDWLIHGKGTVNERPPAATGLAEAATPFQLKPHAAAMDDNQAPLRALFGTAAASPALYRINANLPGFDLVAGDVVLADLARLPIAGEVALATVIDEETANSITLVCRYLPPFLVPGTTGPKVELLRIEDPSVTVRYPVVGSIRGIPPD